MRRVLIAAAADRENWAAAFRAELPGHEVLTAPPADDRPTAYAVVGRPPPGLLRRLPGLEVVLSLNAGIEPLLVPGEVPAAVLIVRMVDPGLVAGMTEWAAAQVLAWHRNLHAYRAGQRAGAWAPLAEKLAWERQVAVLGAGALGGAVAETLARLGFRVRAWSRTPRVLPGVTGFAGRDALGAALAGADVLVNLLPETPATTDIIDAALLARLAPGALVVNGGRGSAIVDADLLAALDAGAVGAAALDVFRTEPLPADHRFWTHERVLLSPHVAAPTHISTAVAVLAQAVRDHDRGVAPAHLVDRARGY